MMQKKLLINWQVSLVVDILDVFYALIAEFKNVLPKVKHSIGGIPENFSRPRFLYTLVFNGDNRSSCFTKDTVLDLQIIYFGLTDKYGEVDFEDNLKTMNQLKQFLSQFNLNVKDRNLKFDYSFGEADEQLTINMHFKFKDGLVNLKYDEEQAREMIERIFMNEEEVI